MRLLQLHSDFVEYQPIAKEIREAEENVSSSKVRFEDLVVTLVAIENGDDENLARIAVNEIERYLATVKSKRLLIYPTCSGSYNVNREICEGTIRGRS
jgi:threonyl-tRNA synthetase